MANWASQLGDKIPQEILAFIVHWFIILLVCFVIGGGAIFLLFTFVTKPLLGIHQLSTSICRFCNTRDTNEILKCSVREQGSTAVEGVT